MVYQLTISNFVLQYHSKKEVVGIYCSNIKLLGKAVVIDVCIYIQINEISLTNLIMAFDIDYFEGGCSVGWGGVVVCGTGIVGLGASVVNIVGVLDSVGDGKVPSTEIINHDLK